MLIRKLLYNLAFLRLTVWLKQNDFYVRLIWILSILFIWLQLVSEPLIKLRSRWVNSIHQKEGYIRTLKYFPIIWIWINDSIQIKMHLSGDLSFLATLKEIKIRNILLHKEWNNNGFINRMSITLLWNCKIITLKKLIIIEMNL